MLENSTISLKNMVTLLYCSAFTSSPALRWSAMLLCVKQNINRTYSYFKRQASWSLYLVNQRLTWLTCAMIISLIAVTNLWNGKLWQENSFFSFLERLDLWWLSHPFLQTTQVSNILPWKHLVKKFISFVFFVLQLPCSFIYNSLQVVCVFFHHGEHVVDYTNGSERNKGKKKNSWGLAASYAINGTERRW